MDTETTATPGQLYPGAPCSAQDWKRIRQAVFDRVARERPNIVYGDLMAITDWVEAEMRQSPNATGDGRGIPRTLDPVVGNLDSEVTQ